MRKIIILLLVIAMLLFVTSCRSVKKTIKADFKAHTELKEQATKKDSLVVVKNATTTEKQLSEVNKDVVTELTRIELDTLGRATSITTTKITAMTRAKGKTDKLHSDTIKIVNKSEEITDKNTSTNAEFKMVEVVSKKPPNYYLYIGVIVLGIALFLARKSFGKNE